MHLEHQVALVTGASRGLGLAIARALAGEGASLGLLARASEELERAASQVRALGHPVMALPYDLTVDAEVESAVRAVMETWGRLDILVLNAGAWAATPIHDATEDQWEKLVGLNLKGAFLACRHAVPWMIEQKRGTIVAINSVGGLVASPGNCVYAASKFGLRGLMESLSTELKPHGIRVSVLYPHNMNTQGRPIAPDSDERRRFIEAADVARLVAYVCTAPENLVLHAATVMPASAAVTLGDVPLEG